MYRGWMSAKKHGVAILCASILVYVIAFLSGVLWLWALGLLLMMVAALGVPTAKNVRRYGLVAAWVGLAACFIAFGFFWVAFAILIAPVALALIAGRIPIEEIGVFVKFAAPGFVAIAGTVIFFVLLALGLPLLACLFIIPLMILNVVWSVRNGRELQRMVRERDAAPDA